MDHFGPHSYNAAALFQRVACIGESLIPVESLLVVSARYNVNLWKIPNIYAMKIKFRNALSLLAVFILLSSLFVAAEGWGFSDAENDSVRKTHSPNNYPADTQELDASVLLQRSSHALFHSRPFGAAIRMKINLFDQRLVGEGRYLQAGQGHRCASRFELSFEGNRNPLNILQICNRGFYYRFRSTGKKPKLEVVDLSRIADIDSNKLIANHSTWMATGGLASFITNLADNFVFETVERSEINGVRVFVLKGRWNEDRLKRIIFGQINYNLIRDEIDWSRMPKQLPQEIEVVLSDDEYFPLFPYQIRFFRNQMKDDSIVQVETVSLQFYQLDKFAEVGAGQFEVNFEGMPFSDLTNKM
ncbi:MAG: hypothetical protein AAGA30_14115, partial [Planctomycetota bacterium]